MTIVLMRNDERKVAIQRFGYTEREADFLCLAALHGGYFLRRQYNAFLECHRGGNADRLIEKGALQGHIRVHESANRTQIYHVGAKSFFKAIGEEDNRNRRWRQPYPVKVKLMGLDFVLAHPQHHYLATEAEKLDYFAGTTGPESQPPSAAYLPVAARPQYHHTLFRRQVSAVSLWRVERAISCGRVLLCGRQHREAFGVRYLPVAVPGVIQSARPFWDHLYRWG